MTRPFLTISCAALALVLHACAGGTPPSAGTPSSGSAGGAGGAVASSAPETVLEGVYTDAQADRGAAVFRDSCSECHGSREFRGDKFFLSYDGVTVGRFVDQLVRTMPEDAPGTLPTTHYVDVTAFILRLNEFPTGATELPTRMEVLNAIRIERVGEAR